MNKIYISGKITGLRLTEARARFDKAESELVSRYNCDVINPMSKIPYEPGKTWSQYMLDDIALLFSCDAIYMLDNWKDSTGARIEFAIACELSKIIIFEKCI